MPRANPARVFGVPSLASRQRELARRLGTTQKYVWELEAGKPSIVMDRLFAAMRETGMDLTATITPRSENG